MGFDCEKCGIRIEFGSSNANECAVSVLVQYAMHLHVVPQWTRTLHTSMPRHSRKNAPSLPHDLYLLVLLRTSATRATNDCFFFVHVDRQMIKSWTSAGNFFSMYLCQHMPQQCLCIRKTVHAVGVGYAGSSVTLTACFPFLHAVQ